MTGHNAENQARTCVCVCLNATNMSLMRTYVVSIEANCKRPPSHTAFNANCAQCSWTQ